MGVKRGSLAFSKVTNNIPPLMLFAAPRTSFRKETCLSSCGERCVDCVALNALRQVAKNALFIVPPH